MRGSSLAIIVTAITLAPSVSEAQIFRRPARTEPAVWISAGVGYYNPGDVSDGATSSIWDWGGTAQYRGTLELPVGRNYTLGVTGTYADMPLRYQRVDENFGPEAGVDAHAKIWSALGTFHVSATSGFHQIIDISAGVIGYQKFTTDADGTPLPPAGTDADFMVSLGYGVGYAFTPRTELALVQEYGYAFHQHDNLPGNAGTSSRQTALRVSLRVGLGHRPGI